MLTRTTTVEHRREYTGQPPQFSQKEIQEMASLKHTIEDPGSSRLEQQIAEAKVDALKQSKGSHIFSFHRVFDYVSCPQNLPLMSVSTVWVLVQRKEAVMGVTSTITTKLSSALLWEKGNAPRWDPEQTNPQLIVKVLKWVRTFVLMILFRYWFHYP